MTGSDYRERAEEAEHLLGRAAQLIAEPKGWTRGTMARDRHSKPVSPSSGRAVRFCARGALFRAASERFGVTFRIGAADEEPAGESWVMPLALAYRYLGRALLLLFLWPTAQASEEKVGEGWQVRPEARDVLEGDAGAQVSTASWPSVVHTVNDHRVIKHRDLVFAFGIARTLAAAEVGRESDGDGAPPEVSR